MKCFFILIISLTVLACNKKQTAPDIPLSEFNDKARVMIGVVTKISKEQNIEKLKKIATYTQFARVVDCKDVLHECKHYNDILTKMIRYTEDGQFDNSERKDIQEKIQALKLEISQARQVLLER